MTEEDFVLDKIAKKIEFKNDLYNIVCAIDKLCDSNMKTIIII